MESTNPYQAPSADLDNPALIGEYDQTSPLSVKGRFGRLSYLAWYMVVAIISWVVMLVLSVAGVAVLDPEAMQRGEGFGSLAMAAVFFLITLAPIYFYVVFGVRRLHDMNMSGWLLLLMLVPLVNIIFGLVMLFVPGKPTANDYGPPRLTPTWEKVLGVFAIVAFLATIVFSLVFVIPAFQGYIEAASQASGG